MDYGKHLFLWRGVCCFLSIKLYYDFWVDSSVRASNQHSEFELSVFEVVKVQWWMQHYSAPTPKRHYGYSNSAVTLALDKGPLKKDQRKPKEERIRTVISYFDKKGVKRYKGTQNLRPTENLDYCFVVFWMYEKFETQYLKIALITVLLPFTATRKPRIYPWPFARALVDMVENMKETASGCPRLPDEIPSAFETFNSSWDGPSDIWQYVDFSGLFTYLRGNRKLKIPSEWRVVIPNRLG